VQVRDLREDERGWLTERLTERWGAVQVARLGELLDASVLPAMVAEQDGVAVGMLTYEVVGDAFEIVTIDAFLEGAQVGSALLTAAAERATELGCTRLWLITTNDNLRALRFYQRRGLRLVALHPGAVDAARVLKPSIPLVGDYGIEIHDEIELARQT
jgi:ribosomal protein S18 acetylase RimI-like enzyme